MEVTSEMVDASSVQSEARSFSVGNIDSMVGGEPDSGEGQAREEGFGGEKRPTREQLMGIVEEKQEEETAAPDAEEETADPTEAKSDEETQSKDEPAKAEDKAKAPPKGFVPHGALAEERARSKELSATVNRLTVQLSELMEMVKSPRQPAIEKQAPETKEEPEGFKVLTRDEYVKLAEDDVVAAQQYLFDLKEHEAKQAKDAEEKKAVSERVSREMESSTKARAKLLEVIPDMAKPEFREELTSFAKEHGVDDTLLSVIHPDTMVMAPSMKEPMILGEGAVVLTTLINELMKAKKGTGAIKEEALVDATKKVVQKLARGAKTPPSIGEVPGEAGASPAKSGPLSEEEYRRLPKEQRMKLLYG